MGRHQTHEPVAGGGRVGIPLGDILDKQPTSAAEWRGRWVAFDAWNVLYQFVASIRGPDGKPLTNARGEVTSHLNGVLTRCASLLEAGVKPVWVFDGKPHPLKMETLAARTARKDQAQIDYEAALAAGDMEKARTKAQQTSRMTSPMIDSAKSLLSALGIPVVEAPGEGEAQCAAMAARGDVAAVASQDFDTVLFGAPILLRNLTVSGRRKLPGKQVWVDVAPERIDAEASLAALDLSRDELIDAALLVGTDFCPGIKGIGAKKAVALIRKNGGLEPLLERLAENPDSADSAVERAILEQHEALVERDAVRALFREPDVTADYELAMGVPEAKAVHRLLVDENGFSAGRVDAVLERLGQARGARSQQSLFDF